MVWKFKKEFNEARGLKKRKQPIARIQFTGFCVESFNFSCPFTNPEHLDKGLSSDSLVMADLHRCYLDQFGDKGEVFELKEDNIFGS